MYRYPCKLWHICEDPILARGFLWRDKILCHWLNPDGELLAAWKDWAVGNLSRGNEQVVLLIRASWFLSYLWNSCQRKIMFNEGVGSSADLFNLALGKMVRPKIGIFTIVFCFPNCRSTMNFGKLRVGSHFGEDWWVLAWCFVAIWEFRKIDRLACMALNSICMHDCGRHFGDLFYCETMKISGRMYILFWCEDLMWFCEDIEYTTSKQLDRMSFKFEDLKLKGGGRLIPEYILHCTHGLRVSPWAR